MIVRLAALVALALTIGAAPVTQVSSAPADAHDVIVKMLARNPSLSSYKARLHVDVHMLNFPYLSPKLDGTSYYKRPSNYEVIFDRVPSYAKGFSRLFNVIGDPGAWEKDQNVTLDQPAVLEGHPVLVLRLTKKIHSDILAHTLAFVDASTYELLQMEWHYTSGGTIVMKQNYRQEGEYVMLSSQHATINIPHIHAVADSQYATYDTNVAVDDAVFTKP